MNPTLRLIIMALIGLLPAACGSNRDHLGEGPLTPLPGDAIDPDDSVAELAVTEFLKETKAPAFSMYQVARHDLNGDKRREALVLFNNPYGYWCDMHGCTMLVFEAHDDHFTLVNAIQPVREPLYISASKNKGWKNMIAHISGRWDETKDVALLFDGKKYPGNPSALPEYTALVPAAQTRIFHDY